MKWYDLSAVTQPYTYLSFFFQLIKLFKVDSICNKIPKCCILGAIDYKRINQLVLLQKKQ